MVFAYCRVSSKDQNIERQVQAVKDYAHGKNIVIDRFFEEKASGKDFSREIYQGMKIALRSGDTLIITELDRLGRNMEQIKNEWRELQKSGVDIVVTDNELLNTANKTDLEKSLICSITFEILTYVAQKEREKMRSRQAEGIAIAKAAGKYKGRKPIECGNFDSVYKMWRAGEIKAVQAMRMTGLTKATFYRRAKLMTIGKGIKV